jgi:hypothetical protein
MGHSFFLEGSALLVDFSFELDPVSEADPEPDPVPELDPDPDPESDFAVSDLFSPADAVSPDCFGDEYRSLYQPAPLRWNDVAEISRSSAPPHASHSVIGGSVIRCVYSKIFPQASQRYS